MKGKKHENVTIFLNIYCIYNKRTNKEFCTFSDIKHHTGVSALIYIEPIINVNHFILDPMH